jgi:hypothetical protein
MRKSLIFISAALTTFVMAVLGGVTHAYTILKAATPSAQQANFSASQQLLASVADPVQIQSVSPQDAAAVAAKFLGRADLYSVELADFNGAQTYKVTFSSGHIVYVSLIRQVLDVQPPQQTVITASQPGRKQGGGGVEPRGGDGEHEGGDD